jgi:hypothetical protein
MESLFDEAEAQRRKERGMALAAGARPLWLAYAQRRAYELAQRNGTVNSDELAYAMEMAGHSYEALGNARGSVFRRLFEWTGEVIPSKRPSTHGRMIKVWRLKEVWR